LSGLCYNVTIQIRHMADDTDWLLIKLIFFAVKEFFFFTIPSAMLIAVILAGLLMLLLGPGVLILRHSVSAVAFKKYEKMFFYDILPFIRLNFEIGLGCLYNMSSTARIVTLLSWIRSRELNDSVKDFDAKLARVGNVLFDISLLLFVPDSFHNADIFVSLFVSTMGLMFAMVREKTMLGFHYDALKDLNENRMSKFEVALYMVKIIEDFITDEVTFNFVEHFYTPSRFQHGFLEYMQGRNRLDDFDQEYAEEVREHERAIYGFTATDPSDKADPFEVPDVLADEGV